MKIKTMVVALLTAILLSGCGDIGGSKPPLGVSFRTGFLSDAVLQVHNLSDSRVMIHIHAVYPPTSEEIRYSFSISPNAVEEYGALELGSWQFSPGGHGDITADGYSGKIKFRVYKENGKSKYEVW